MPTEKKSVKKKLLKNSLWFRSPSKTNEVNAIDANYATVCRSCSYHLTHNTVMMKLDQCRCHGLDHSKNHECAEQLAQLPLKFRNKTEKNDHFSLKHFSHTTDGMIKVVRIKENSAKTPTECEVKQKNNRNNWKRQHLFQGTLIRIVTLLVRGLGAIRLRQMGNTWRCQSNPYKDYVKSTSRCVVHDRMVSDSLRNCLVVHFDCGVEATRGNQPVEFRQLLKSVTPSSIQNMAFLRFTYFKSTGLLSNWVGRFLFLNFLFWCFFNEKLALSLSF